MRLLETLLEQPFALALGWALLHFIWQGTLLALLLAGVCGLRGNDQPTRAMPPLAWRCR
jgi:hypothetical protein